MKFFYLDSRSVVRGWANVKDASCLEQHHIPKLDQDSVVFVHSSDWATYAVAPSATVLGVLRSTLSSSSIARCAQLVFFSGDWRELAKKKADIEKQLAGIEYRGPVYFVEHNVESAPASFGMFVHLGIRRADILSAKDILSEEREVLGVAFVLLLQTYLLKALGKRDIPQRFAGVREAIKGSSLKIDKNFWAPVAPTGILDPRLSMLLEHEGLGQLEKCDKLCSMVNEPALNDALVSWINNREKTLRARTQAERL